MTAAGLIRVRHLVQWGLLAAFVLIPFTGLFRVDVATGRFLIAGYQIWWDDFFIVFGFWAMLFFSMTAFYANFGMIFCGWMCPQHTLSEWLNGVIRRMLGRRLLVGISPERVAGRSKRKKLPLVLAWVGFVLLVLVVSALLTLSVLHYFFPFAELWGHFIGGRYNAYIAVFSILLGAFTVVDLGLLRHFWCKYMCPYGLWQYMFRGPGTLQIRFDASRADDCRKCTLCKDVCPVDLEPTQPEVYTRCINCAICIDACASYMGRFGKQSLLSFGFGTQSQELVRIEKKRSLFINGGVLWPVSGMLAATCLFAWGVHTFEPIRLVIHQETTYELAAPGGQAQKTASELAAPAGLVYRAVIVNKDDRSRTFSLAVTGPEQRPVALDEKQVVIGAGKEATVTFFVPHAGLEYDRPYPVTLTATRSDTGRRTQAEEVYYLPDLAGMVDNRAGLD